MAQDLIPASDFDFNSVMGNYSAVLEDLKYIADLSNLSGGLSNQEQSFIDSIRETATQNLVSSINESTVDLANTEIAKLVDRGVISGGIGEETISRIYDRAGKSIEQGVGSIENSLAQLSLGLVSENKNRALSAETALLNSLTSMQQSEAQNALQRELSGDRNALTRELAGQEMGAYEKANWMQLLGNIGGSAISAYPLIKALGGSGGLTGGGGLSGGVTGSSAVNLAGGLGSSTAGLSGSSAGGLAATSFPAYGSASLPGSLSAGLGEGFGGSAVAGHSLGYQLPGASEQYAALYGMEAGGEDRKSVV